MSGIAIRGATADDYLVLQRIYRRASRSNAGDRAGLIAHPEHLRLDPGLIGRGRTVVAELVDGTVVGFASTTPTGSSALELDDLFVDPDHRREGAARELLRRITTDAGAEIQRIEVTANPHAAEFYRAVGFEVTGTLATELGRGTRMQLPLRDRRPT
jgi:ribosomal protein S18 acetylase RimI-like enzyme